MGFQTRGCRGRPAPLPCMLTAGGRDPCILRVEGTTEVTPADGMCSPEVTVRPWAAGPPPLPPWPAPCGRCAGRLGAAGQQALASPRPSEPASHLLSPSQRRLPLPLGSAPRRGSAPATAAQARWLLGPLSRAGCLVSGKSKLPLAEHCHGAYQCEELLSLVGRPWALYPLTLPPQAVCALNAMEKWGVPYKGV